MGLQEMRPCKMSDNFTCDVRRKVEQLNSYDQLFGNLLTISLQRHNWLTHSKRDQGRVFDISLGDEISNKRRPSWTSLRRLGVF